MQANNRGVVDFVDVIIAGTVLIGLLVTAPFYYEFTNMVATEADPLSALLLRLVVPLLFLSMLVSVGVSARGGA